MAKRANETIEQKRARMERDMRLDELAEQLEAALGIKPAVQSNVVGSVILPDFSGQRVSVPAAYVEQIIKALNALK